MTDAAAGKVVVVVGGTSGIGAAIAAGLASAGWQVTATGATPGEVTGARGTLTGVACEALDVRDDQAVQVFASRFDELHGLVNCAGTVRRGEEQQPDVFSQVVDINLNGTFRCCAAFADALSRSGGSIVNTASMLSFFGGVNVAYASSKGGVAQLTKSLALVYAPRGVRVNAIAPGWIRTALTEALHEDSAQSARIVGRTPLARWGRPEDLSGPVQFLLSSAAAFITGCILPVDGGYLIA